MNESLGGEAPCKAREFEEPPGGSPPVICDLGGLDLASGSRVPWSLPHGGDLDANLIRLGSEEVIAGHLNEDVDVLMAVLAGDGEVMVDGAGHQLKPETLVVVHKGSYRSIQAGSSGLTYLSVHRRRGPLSPRQGSGSAS